MISVLYNIVHGHGTHYIYVHFPYAPHDITRDQSQNKGHRKFYFSFTACCGCLSAYHSSYNLSSTAIVKARRCIQSFYHRKFSVEISQTRLDVNSAAVNNNNIHDHLFIILHSFVPNYATRYSKHRIRKHSLVTASKTFVEGF
jgi:hypothetical protein